MKWKPQSRDALRVVSIMIGPLFDTESLGPRPGFVEIRCSITVNTWPRLIGSRPASASALTAWLPDNSCRTSRSIWSRSASSPSFVMTCSLQTLSKNALGILLLERLVFRGIQHLLPLGEHHQLLLDAHDRALLVQVLQ